MITPTHKSMPEGGVGAPASSPFPSSRISGQDRNVQAQRKLLVLVVDDEPVLARMWARIVTQAGHIPETAADGREALEKYAAAKPDLVISDFHMPNMNGIELFRKLKAENPNVKMIILSGDITPQEADKCLAEGVKAVFRKPLDPPILIDAINQFGF